jgi:hypothetical protein
MNNKVLVVESKNGKVSQKYITKKEAQKHMSERHDRHDRLDRYAPKKSTKKSSKKNKKSSKKNKKSSKKNKK